ncbi:MAG: SEC-C domain-containing protein [Prevotella sp.]|nr:SEC-C domain-containing protein [Prevotella sp.]
MNISSFTVKTKGRVKAITSECLVSTAFNPKAKVPFPKPRKYTALWDTGATGSVISSKVVAELGLKPICLTRVFTASSNVGVIVNVYQINIMLPNKVGMAYLRVTEGSLSKNTDVLIGMDIISQGDFAITHSGGDTTFTFQIPSTHDIDFVKEANNQIPKSDNTAPKGEDPCPCGSGKKFKDCHGKNLR